MLLFEPTLAALGRAGVRYVVVGGVAVVMQGYARLTADLDLAIDLAPDQATRAVDTLVGLGLVPRLPVDPHEFADPDVRRSWIAERNLQVTLHDPNDPFRQVDLFAEDPVPFEELWQRAMLVQLGSTSVRIASLPDLVAMKRAAGRPQDLADIEALEMLGRPDGDG